MSRTFHARSHALAAATGYARLSRYWLAGLAALCLGACGTEQASTQATAPEASTTGGYAVGSTTRFIHDTSRPFDRVAGVEQGVRTLITELWYPVAAADLGDSKHPSYGDYVFGNRAVHHKMMTATTFFHLTPNTVRPGVNQQQIDAAIEELFQRSRNSYVDAPVAADPWPVVVVSHGDAGSRYNMETVAEYLAAHGYIVIAPEHTGNSPYTMIGADPALSNPATEAELRQRLQEALPLLDSHGAYGQAETFGQSYSPLAGGFSVEGFTTLDQALLERVNDLRAALDELAVMNTSGPFTGRIDLTRIGVMGRSFGGATTLAALGLEQRFAAGLAVVPPGLPDLRPLLPPEALIAPPAESVLLSQGDNPLTNFQTPTLLLMGSEDKLILGLGSQMAKASGSVSPSRETPYPALLEAAQSATAATVFAVADNTNHGSFGVSGPYWWPNLKPDRFPQFYAPEQEFQLLAAEKAHQVQAEIALEWFELNLRDRAGSRHKLSANPWQDTGVSIELFGFDSSHHSPDQ